MPELPEVETVCRGLQPYVEGRKIVLVDLRRKNLRFAFPQGFAEKIQGARVDKITRRAKFILKHLDNDLVWMTHLGMTGRYQVEAGQPASAGKHAHVLVRFENNLELLYTDPRRFGYMDLLSAPTLWENKHFVHLGPEPLSNSWGWEELYSVLCARNTPIKNALLDQSVVSGLGNIYVCEALYRAGISPRRKAKNLGPKRLMKLVPHIRDVLQEAIAAGGSSLRDFAGAEGRAGYFQHAFQVYDREGKACSDQHCKAKIKRIIQSGRSSFFCPKCQN